MGDPLTNAASKGDLAKVRALLDAGPVDQPRLDDALVFAVIDGRLEAVTLLLDRGADPNSDQHGFHRTPLFFAVTGSLAMLDLLLSRGADVHAREDGGNDLLHHYLVAIGPGPRLGSGDVAVVRRLLAAGLDVRGRNADKPHTLLACNAGDVAILELLLEAGADPNAKDREGGVLWAAMKLSERTGEVLAALVRHGVDPHTRCKNAAVDTTMLMEVCGQGDLESASALLEGGADVNARGHGTPLSRAEESGNQPLVDLLLERGATPLLRPLDAAASKRLDAAQDAAHAAPGDLSTRLAWADALLTHGFRAAAASEVAAVSARGEVPEGLSDRLRFERPAGVSWTFAVFRPALEGVAPRTSDARFPGALVTDGARTLPLVVTLGPPCTRCDEEGEEVCSRCGGTGSWTGMFSDDPYDCEPRQPCAACRGLKFVVSGRRLGKGACAHPGLVDEVALPRQHLRLRRCPECGLAALRGTEGHDDFACGVCGHFACVCA